MSVDMLEPEAALEHYKRLLDPKEPAPPLLVLFEPSKGLGLINLADLDGEPRDAMAVVVQMIDAEKIPRPLWVTFSSEAYVQLQVNPNKIPQHGELQARAEAGETIEEAVICVFCHRDGRRWTIGQTFQRVDDEVIWGSLLDTEGISTGGGVIDDLMRRIVRVLN